MQAPVVGPRPARLPRTLLLGVTAATVARSLASPLGAPQGPACPWRPRAGSHERRPGRPEPARPRASPVSSAARRFLIPTETFQQQEVEALRSERPVARSSEVCAVPCGFHLFRLIKWPRESAACVPSPPPPAGLGHAARRLDSASRPGLLFQALPRKQTLGLPAARACGQPRLQVAAGPPGSSALPRGPRLPA